MLEVDDEGGRMFLRVLLHLTMHDYAPLVSGALQLLFKHFSQRQEAMHTFKQVRGHKDLVAHCLTGTVGSPKDLALLRSCRGGSSLSHPWHLPAQLISRHTIPYQVWLCRLPSLSCLVSVTVVSWPLDSLPRDAC